MASFLINHVLVPVLESRIARTVLRVIDVDHQASQLLVIALESPLKKPWILGFEEVLFEIEQGVLRLDQDVPAAYMLKSEDKLTEKEKSSRENTWGLIRELVDGKSAGDLFADGEFGRRVADQAATRNVSRGIIYKLLYRYWAHGQSKNAFLWKSDRWGAPGKRKIYKEGAQPGRPPLYRGVVKSERAIRVTEFDMTCIEASFLRYVNKKEASVKRAFDWMIKSYYREVFFRWNARGCEAWKTSNHHSISTLCKTLLGSIRHLEVSGRRN